nr:RNA polymerase sigma factor [Marivibrio halodurans]
MTGAEDIHEHVRGLHRFATGLLGNPVDAEDLVQECLRRVLNQMQRGAAIKNMHAYLFQTLRNVHIDECRRAAGRGTVMPIDETVAEPLTAPPNQEDGIRCGDIRACLDRLPEHQREVVLLVCLEEISYEGVAEIIGQPIGTVRSRLHRGRAALQAMLDAANESGPADKSGSGVAAPSARLHRLGRAENG